MKHFIPLLFLSLSVHAQKVITDKKDEFTGNIVRETSVEKLAHPVKMSGFAYNFSAKKVNGHYFLDLRMMSLNKQVFAIRKESKLMLLLKNDSVITLLASDFEVSGKGKAGSGLSAQNAEGLRMNYPISEEEIAMILRSDIHKIRVYTSDGYTEQEIKEAGSEKVKKAFGLLL
jgi:hypothetical protein